MFLAFKWFQFYPEGGAKDFFGVYDTLDAAVAAMEPTLLETYPDERMFDHGHVATLIDGQLVVVAAWNSGKRRTLAKP